ncbi:MAG: hypothetical protein M3T55_03010 [Pseudomonadota bacterium]|nr:hypothetical protein [Pseudomonadota bacterium]
MAGYLRVNQIGYEAGEAARAYLVTRASAEGDKFEVRDGLGQLVLTGPVGRPSGAWGCVRRDASGNFDCQKRPLQSYRQGRKSR